ncbi:MAG: excinuclease ABC subunit UvrA [Thiotrichaceae bacterium]|nr:excinuclease ABC subunit UvrA [Thiotrichaceae bacterium]
MKKISLRGVRTHNLKNFDIDLPRNQLIVITGLSGSGKSSLAFDTIFAEGQRRYVESLSAYARQFLSIMEKPDIDHIEGLSPAISIEQKTTSHNPRSTVGTITEIYDYLRLLFARAGIPRCPEHGQDLEAQTVSQMVDSVLNLPEGSRIMLLAPVVRKRKGEHIQLFESLRSQGFLRLRINDVVYDIDELPKLALRKKHTIEVVVDRIKVRADLQLRLAESFETALKLADGLASIRSMDEKNNEYDQLFSANYACPHCGYSLAELEPRLFSFNSPAGACQTCDGLGIHQKIDPEKVVAKPELSLSEGAIRSWDKRNTYYYQLITSLAKHYQFDIEASYESLPKKIQKIVLYGSGKTSIDFTYIGQKGQIYSRKHSFEGIINNMQRRYRETDSNSVREDMTKYMSSEQCPDCHGTRLSESARHVFLADSNLPQITELPIGDALKSFNAIKLTGKQATIAEKVIHEIRARLEFLVNVGLDYLSLNRSSDSLSGGEAQRIRLASQIGAGLVGVMYVLDEPSIGLHQRDNARLLKTLEHLRELGNTVIVVEHDEEAIRMADHVIDIGPGAGKHGGEIVAQGTPEKVAETKGSCTADFLSGRRKISVPKKRTPTNKHWLKLEGATGNNLQNINVAIPVGLLTCVTGVSGSGKSTLINRTLYPSIAKHLNRSSLDIAPHKKITGLEYFDKIVDINQSPIGRTPRSNPATYTGVFTPIRELFAATQEARSRGYTPGRFSFNVKGGRCEACRGDGLIKVEMHFLPDVYVPCDVCSSKRYNCETLDVHYKGKNINEVLEMTVEEAHEFFQPIPSIFAKLDTLMAVGLSYITLGQNATTLSGGEAQRIKLAKELSKRSTGRTLYILDEPTTGLHFHDVDQLLKVLHRLRNEGNTVIIIEHNLDVVKTADWIIDLGPEGGCRGGALVAEGTPEAVSKIAESYTGQFLKAML